MLNRVTKLGWAAAPLLMVALLLPAVGCKSSGEVGDWDIGYTPRRPIEHQPVKAEPAPRRPVPMTDAGRYYLTSYENSSVIYLEKMMPGEVAAGVPFEYTIRATNISNVMVRDVVVTDELSQNFRFNSSDPSTSPSGNVLQWNLGEFQPGQSKTITVRGTAGSTGEITTCAHATYIIPLCATTRVVEPGLDITLTGPAQVSLCDVIPLKIEVCNPGSGITRNVQITHNLPNGLTTTDGQRSVTIDVGELAPGQCRAFAVNAKASSTGNYNNVSRATAAGNLSDQSGQVSTRVVQAVLAVSCDSPGQQFIGRGVRHTYTVRNTGDTPATNTRLVVALTGGTASSASSASDGGTIAGNQATWNFGTLAAGQSRSVTVTLEGAARGRLTTDATVTADCAEPARASCGTEMRGIPAVLLEVIDVDDPVEVGSTTTYVITVTNQGSADGTNIRVAAELEDEFEFVSGTGTTAVTGRGKSITLAPLAELDPGAVAEWRITVRALPGGDGDHRFRVIMNEDQLGRPVEETEATRTYSFD